MTGSKQAILDSAVRLFNERGYDKVSLRDIAREAGLAIGSLTYHFKKKEDLLNEMLADLHGGFSDAFDASLRGDALLSHLLDLFEAGEANQRRYPFYFQNMTLIVRCSTRIAEEARRFEGELYAYYRESLDALAIDGMLRRGLTPAQLDALTYAMVTMQGAWSVVAGPFANGIEPMVGSARGLASVLSACLSEDALRSFEELCHARGIAL